MQRLVPQEIADLKKELLKIRPAKSSAIYDMAVYLANKPYNVSSVIIEKLTKPNDIILDPFLGSGVTVVESVKLGRKSIGVDINPYSILITKASLGNYDLDTYMRLVSEIAEQVKGKINSLYVTKCDECKRMEAIIVKEELSNGKLDYVRYYCPYCVVQLLKARVKNKKSRKIRRTKEPVKIKIVTRSPAIREDHQSLRIVDKVDYKISTKALKLATTRFVQNSRLCILEGEKMSNFFSKRNLLATCLLYDAIQNLPEGKERELVEFTFLSGLHLMKYTDYKSNSQATYYRPNVRLAERNVWKVFMDRVKLVVHAREEWQNELAEKAIEGHSITDLKKGNATYLVTVVDTKDLSMVIPNGNTVDFVLTDPPYADQVQYLDYGQLWNIWADKKVDWEKEIVISDSKERKDKNTDAQYAQDMKDAFREIGRVLKPNGYACVYFHDLKLRYLNILMRAMKDAGFEYIDQTHIEDDVPTFKVANNPAGTLAGHVLLFFRRLSKEEQPVVISGINVDEVIVEEAQRIIADNDGSATTPQLMDEGITKILYETNILDEMVKKYDTVVPILKKYLDYNEEGGLWTIRNKDIEEGKISSRIPVKSRLKIYIPNIVNRLHTEKGEFTLSDVINRGLYPLINDPNTPVDEGDILDVLNRYSQKTEDGTKWRKRLLDKYRDDLKIHVRDVLADKGKATIIEVYKALLKLKEKGEIPYAFDKNDVMTILQTNFIFMKKGSRFTADLTGYLGLSTKEGAMLDEDLLLSLTKMDPHDFERFVGEMVTQMGFVSEQGKYTADGGVDVKAKLETDLGSTIYAIQVKRYSKPVSVEPLRELVGVMQDFTATNGVFITTSHFTMPAKEYGGRHNIELIDGKRLIELIKKYKLFSEKVGAQKKLTELGFGALGITFFILNILPKSS